MRGFNLYSRSLLDVSAVENVVEGFIKGVMKALPSTTTAP